MLCATYRLLRFGPTDPTNSLLPEYLFAERDDAIRPAFTCIGEAPGRSCCRNISDRSFLPAGTCVLCVPAPEWLRRMMVLNPQPAERVGHITIPITMYGRFDTLG